MKSHRGADAFAAQDVAKLMQRLAEYTLGPVLQWEENERARPDQKVDAFASFLRAHASHSVRLRGSTVGWAVPEWKQSVSVYPMLDREGKAVTAGQR